MIGSGIFIVSADIARRLPAPGWLLAVWAIAGALTVTGALSYGHLAAAMPRAGGQYVYLSELYGPLWGFLYGWTLVLVIQTGTIAAVAVAFATYAGELWPALTPSQALFSLGRITVSPVQAVAAGVVVLLTALNARGLEAGRWVQNVFTVAKVGTLLAVIALGIQHAAADRVGSAAIERLAGGAVGARLMALAVMVSTFGCANGLVLAGARVAWAMARDGLFLAPAARLNDRHVPGPALWMQGAWASVLALSGRYSDLLDYVIVAELLFYLLTVGGLLVLARRSGERPRGAGYPWLQLAYLVLVAALVVDLLVTKPAYTWGSVAVVASGVPVYALGTAAERGSFRSPR